ncbi:ATP-NAD kinase-like domain containing protein [Nitzschia inconspicua]|uniref:ATP-NAD kinase-like domain containing protein n=1 Tax=Nitzschia inconspicua TaxID=303405 RepID=A0A9K3K8I4_9STRA|nr:diacylglycerol kinase catalytic domain containing protein [Nitzschia inconspicua]KAG7359503.1 ATP-NAD kinase-like domain containing protein [Nitzschia inconspicua]
MKDYLVLITVDDDEKRNNNCNKNDNNTDSTSVTELLSWTREHIALLSTTTVTMMVKTQAVADRLVQEIDALNEEKRRKDEANRDDKMPSFQWQLEIEVLLQEDESNGNYENFERSTSDIWDLLLVNKILSQGSINSSYHVVGVFVFPGQIKNTQTLSSTAALDNLSRICQYSQPSIPLALNRTTASLCVKALFHTRVAYVIFNPAAGQRPAEEDLATLKQVLEPYMRLKIFLTEKDRSVADQASEIVNLIRQEQTQQLVQSTASCGSRVSDIPDNKFMIIASGGDGTVSAIAGATLNSGIPVGIVPRGTANAFSVALGIPTDSVESACQLILRRTVRLVDGALLSAELLWHSSLLDEDDVEAFHNQSMEDVVPRENSDGQPSAAEDTSDQPHPALLQHIPKSSRWINHAGLGFEAGLVDNATRELKDKFGNLAYTIGAAQQIFRDEQFRCTFVVDGDDSTEKTVETNIITIANVDPPSSIFAQGFGKVLPDDGLFEVTIGTASGLEGIRELATLMANAIVRDKLGSDTILCFRCRQIKVTCDPPQKLLVDGEVIRDMDTVTFTCVPKGLKIIAPVPPKDNR